MHPNCPECGYLHAEQRESDSAWVCAKCGAELPPKGPVDPRPGGVPYFIDNECEDCGSTLVLNDRDKPPNQRWYDEWECPYCQDGVYMDWPEEYKEKILNRDISDFKFEEL